MKRLEILLVNHTTINIKTDFKYVVTQVKSYDDALIKFQTENYDIVAFPKEVEMPETVNMIQKLVDVQDLNTKIILFDNKADLAIEFAKLYQNQHKREEFNIDIQDDALIGKIICTL